MRHESPVHASKKRARTSRYDDRFTLLLGVAAARVLFLPPGYFEEYSRTEVEHAYHWTARYVLEFLNATLKNDASARALLDRKPIGNGVPRHTATIQHAKAQPGALPTREGFAEVLRRRGFDHGAHIYRKLHTRDPAFVLSETEINLWGYALMA